MTRTINRIAKALKNPRYLTWKISTRARIYRKRLQTILRRRNPSAPQTRAVMFHAGRSGSTVLGDMLNQHPDIYWADEIAKGLVREASTDPEVNEAAFTQLLDKELDQSAAMPAYGFEIKPFHLEQLGIPLSRFVDILTSRHFNRVIILERKNYLRKIVSSLIASKYGTWHQPRKIRSETKTVEIDPESVAIDMKQAPLVRIISDYENAFKQARDAFTDFPVTNLTYEDDLLPAPDQTAQQCFAFLAQRSVPVEPVYGRSNPQRLDEIISNYDQIRQTLRDTPHEWMLEV